MTDSLGLAPYDYQDVKSTVPVLDYWRMAVPLRKDLGSEYWPTVNSMEWPWGTKGTYISKEAALRNGNLLGFNLFGTERTIRKYAKARNAHVIGDGIVAFPPCSPQPYCIILEVLGNKIAGTSKMCVPAELAILPATEVTSSKPCQRQKRRLGRGVEDFL